MKILTEDDYLDAHLTVIREEFRGGNLIPHNFKERLKLTINRPDIERVPQGRQDKCISASRQDG